MYLSKILVNGLACRNPYEIHRALWKLFPADAFASRDFLFRVEQADLSQAEVLMQSSRKPEKLSNTVQILACKEYELLLSAGCRLRFLLLANPIKMIKDESGRKNADGETKKCRVPLLREDDQRAWIEHKFREVASFETLTIDHVSPLKFRKNRENRAGKIQPVLFQGILKILNAEAMITLVKTGVGPAKAFGCGLVSLARA